MKNSYKRILAFFLAVIISVGAMPVDILAQEVGELIESLEQNDSSDTSGNADAEGSTEADSCDHLQTTIEVQEPTCKENGYRQTVCSLCSEIISKTELEKSTDHTPSEAVIIEPGCKLPGSETVYCSVCNEKLSETILPITEHTPGKDADCTNDQICAVCRTVLSPAIGHLPNSEGRCMYCSAKSVLTDGIKYTLNEEDGTATVTGYTGGSKEIYITNTIEGCTVTAISAAAFADADDITSVTIPGTITNIEENAFSGCSSLSLVIFNSTEEQWNSVNIASGNEPFLNCEKLFFLRFESNGAMAEVRDDVIASDADFICTVSDPESIDIKSPAGFETENSAVYSISFEKDGEMIAPMFPFTLSIPLPETLSGEKCKVFHIDENGNADGINSYYENGYLRFATSLSGNFAIMSIAYSICDVNADGIISAKDLNLINKALAGILPFTPESLAFFAADVDADGILTAKDLNKAYRIVSGGESMPAVCVHYERTVPGYAATCEESGLTDGVVCEKCHKILTAQAEIPPLGHYSVITEHIEPTCTDNGYIKRICLVCELEYAAEILYSKGHSFSEGEVMRNATCTEEGIIQSTCSECGKTNSTLTDKIAHSYELTSENDDGTSTYTCFACGFTTVTSGAPDGTSTERFENKCPADYTFEIVSENDEEYIRENLKIIDLRYKDTENEADGYVSYELTDMGDTVKVSPTQGYTEGNSYVATVSGDIQFADNSSTELLFSIEREETSEIDINDDVVFITLPDEGSAERDKYIVDTESDENYIYATIPSGSGYDHVTVGDIVCIGEYTSEEHFVNTPGLYANFGKVDQKLNASGDSFTLVLSCPALEEIYDYMDVHYNKYAIIEDEETLEAIEDQVEQSLYASEYMNEYLTSSILTAKVYAAENSLEIEEHDINVALGKLNLQFESKNIENGIYVSAYGSFDIITKDKDNYTYTLKFFMKASFKATIETSADAAVTWWGRVDKLECFVTTTTVTSFETGVTIELDLELFKSNNPDALIMTPSGIYHTKECVRVSDIAADSYTSITAKEAEEYYDKKNGFITNECPACRPFTSYMNNNFYVSNTDTKTVHKFVCCSLDRFQGNDNLISTNIPRSYTYCESCNPGIGSGISFDEYMYEKLKAVSWSKIYDTVTAYTNKKENQGKVTKEIPVKIIPVYFGAVFEVLVELEVSMELRIEGTFSYEYTQTCINVSGVYLNDDGDLETVSIKDSFAETSKFKVMGKLEFLVGFQAEVKVTFHGCNKFLYISFSIRVGPYFDLYGMFAMDIDSEDKSLSYSYGTVFLEIGFYIDANINFKAFIFDCSLSLIGGTKKLPIIRVGHNIGYYNYIDSPEFLDVTGSKIDLNGYDFNIQSFNVTDPEEVGIDQLDLRGKYGEYTVDITVLDENGEEPNYAYENGGVIRLKSNAPCDLTLTVKISVDDVDPPIESINDLLNVIFRKNRVKYTLEDYIFKVHFTYHRVGGWQITTPPTCTEEGVETKFYICDCRDENGDPLEFIQRSVPALGHKKALIKAIKMTCTTDGYTSGWGCARCDYIFKAPELIPARGHSYADPFTCHDRPCLYSDCSHIEPTSTPHNFTEWMTIPTGSCGGVEFEMRSCVDCFFSESTLPPDSATHGCKYKTAVEKHPTCTEAGYYEFVCENCGETIEKTVPAIGHKWKSGYNSVYHYKECQNQNCTATKDQIKHSYKYECSSKCEKCAYERGSAHIWDNEYVPYGTGHRQKCSICKSHSPIEEHIGGIPTCTEKGSCILCDESYIDATGHDYSLAVPSEEYLATEATCTQSATYYYLCADCNEVGSTTYSHGDKTEHPWKDTYTPGVECHWIGCSVCSATKGKDVHTGGTASCLERAICSVCNSPYGDTNSHIYDNDCDIECNECGHIRTAPHNWSAGYITGETEHWKLCLDCSAETDRASHNYSGACGSECTSGCGTTRVPPHSWKDVLEKDEKSHWTECALCHEKKDAADHIYDSVCDSDCNICSYVRIAPHNLPEEYIVTESEHWKTCADCSLDIGRDAHSGGSATCQSPAICSLCFESYGSATDHRYDEPCGSECTFDCGTTRVPPHSWRVVLEKDETSHWAECDICHEKKTISNHVYDSNCDSSCDICSYERIAPHNLPEEYTVSASEHWKTCADCSLDFERKAHSGGSATCQSPAICSVCSESYGSAADHKYDEPCGSECTFDCGTTRVPPHSWKVVLEKDETSHWAECDICHEKKGAADHIYDSNCDSSCDICSYERIAPHNLPEEYTVSASEHWKTCADCSLDFERKAHSGGSATCQSPAICSVCSESYGSAADHKYDEPCGSECTFDCGTTRVPPHSWKEQLENDESSHWAECELCHEKKDIAGHVYDSNCDSSCDICSYIRIAPHNPNGIYINDDESHWITCLDCNEKADLNLHDGIATCTAYATCSVCNVTYGELADHTYTNACDTTCNACGHEREITHSPDIAVAVDDKYHSSECIVCHETITGEHTGGEATCDTSGACSECGHKYIAPTGHDFSVKNDEHRAADATCSDPESFYLVCSVCGEAGEDIYYKGAPLGHNWIIPDKDEYNHWYRCDRDGCSSTNYYEPHYGGEATCHKTGVCTDPDCRMEYLPKLEHVPEKIIDAKYLAKQASCTEKATYYYVCGLCGDNLSETYSYGELADHIPKDSRTSNTTHHWYKCANDDCKVRLHEEEHYGGIPGCTKAGTCTACRRSYISATGHTKVEIVHEDYFRKEATCTEAESYYYFCSACEKTLSEYFTVGDPLPHDWDEEDYKSDAENHWFKCKNCSAKGYMEAHTFGEYQTVTPATCTEEGEEKKTCSVCSYEESRPIPALGHTISDSYSTLTEGPTVTPSGESIYVHKIVQKCTRFDECGHYVQTGEVVEHAHKETTLLPGANATCTESGLTAGLICGVKGCDHVYVEQEIIPATGHAEGETVTTEATCIRDGATVVLCKNCSAEISNTVIPALGHDYVDGTCTRCGDVDKVQNGTTGSCFWRLEGTVLIIYGSGAMEDYTSISLAPWGTDITEVIIENGVTYIGGSSFSNCQSLTGITIPDSVTRIGYNAFNGCNKLEYISLPDNLIKIELGTFQNCSSLVSITIPDSVTSIGTNAFRNCTSLVSISIPDGVTSIGGSAFQNCPSLTDVTIPKSVTKLDTFAFYSCFAITDVWYEGTADDRAEITIDSYNTDITGAAWHYESCIKNPGEEKVHSYTDDSDADCNFCGAVREVEAAYDATGTTGECYWGLKGTTLIIWGNGAMANYTSSSAAPWGKAITEVIIEEGVISIGDRAFYDCTSLAIITISNGVTSIGGSAFSGCANLTSITIPDSVTSINGHAFNGCKGITSITIPDSVTSIGMYAFYDCSSLSDIIIPVGITSIGSYIFGNCSRLTSINIPNGVTSIGRGAFFSCTNLKSITIPDGVKSIGDGAFNACRCLASITIPDSITAIGGHAFHGCSSLTSITIPDSITTINDYTFNGCSKLTSITIPNSVTSIGKYAFQNCSKLTDVWYEGTADDRAEITIDSYNTDITGAAWHYESCIKNPGEEKVHSYADDSDTDCDFCGAVREVEQTSGITGECTWSLDGTVLTISGNGAMADYTFEDTLPWRNGITEVIIEDGVTSIGSYAFKNCFGLTSISVADSVTSIGDYAFFWCECLESIIFPASLESIGREAFSSCSALSSVTLPKGVTTIADYAFDGCSSLANVWYEGTEEDLANVTVSDGNSSFTGAAWHYSSCMKNPGEEKVHSYADDSDTDCDFCGAVREVEAVYDATGTTGDCYWGLKGTTLTIWGNGAMGNYTSSFDVPWGTDITKVIIEDGVTSIGNHAFSDCSSLTSISLPESLTSIGDYAFCSCSNLASISLPESLTSIGNYAFFNCSDLASIAFPDGITNIGIGAFSSCQKLESVSFLNCKSLTKIRGSSICDCENLTSIILPLTITTIWPYAFFGCPNLTDVWYEGSEADRAQINYAYEFCRDPLKDVNWHYNFCEKSTSEDKVHSYSSDSDTDCDNCGYIRETATEYDAEGTTGDCYWKLKGTVLTIYGNGAMADYTRRQKAPWYSYEITQIIIENGVTHVSDRTFFYNDKIELITSVYLPASLTSIGTDAFNGCINLKRIDFPAGLTDIGESAFANCSGLVNIYFPKSLVTIGEYAFENCENLVNVSMYKGITKIGTDAFTGTSLTDVWCEGNENDHIIIFTNSEITYHYDSCMMFPWATETIGGGGHYYTTVSGNECINCGAVREVECSHTPGDEATCTTAQTCSTCGKVLAEALGHTPGAAATCTTAQVCTVCSTVITNALGHTEGQTVTTVATCTEDGVAVVLCSRCSAEISRTLIPALGHNFVNGTCTRCGESDYDATGTTGDCYWKLKGTTLTIYGNGAMGDYTYKSASPWSTDITEIIIEDGVTSIGTYAFYNCSSLTSVTIPDSVTNINGYAFRSCSSLESITIPDGVTRINDYTFDYCKSLTSITIPDGVNAIGNNAFNGCSSLTSIAIPDSVVSLGNYTFYNCSSLSGIAIPDSVTSIGNFTFCGCSQLISITIPDSIASIGNSAFRDCTGLVNITIPDSVTSIGNCAFYGCSRLIGITIPDSITSINDYTFDFCSRLTNITLPNSVTSIGYEAFHLCSNLTDVWYEGTEEDRTAIAINSYNTPLTGAIWHYESCMKNPGAEKVHSYTDDSDADCDLCGYERAVTG